MGNRLAAVLSSYIPWKGYPPFDHHVSIVDLVLSVGAKAPRHLLTF
jgi:hypothetical protein